MSSDPLENTSTPGAGPSTQPDSAFEKWRSSLSQLTGLGLNPAEVKLRDERLAQERLEGDWNQCEKWKNGLMKSSERDQLLSLSDTRLIASWPWPIRISRSSCSFHV